MSRTASPIWHPFTQHALTPVMTEVVSARGAYLETRNGRTLIDAISSWWVITHGHCHPAIVAAIKEQTEKVDQIIFAGFTHAPAEELAQELVRLTGFDHVFYSDSGSTSVEVALKMALGFFKHRGEARYRIAVLEHGYHGDTIGAMSVGQRGVFNAPYEPLLFEPVIIPFPEAGHAQTTLDALEKACSAGDVAAFILEPLVVGAGGMKMYSANVLKEMAVICARYQVLLILDEVMTGWGRTGTLFAYEQAGIAPDIICLSKGLTNGALPLAVTLCRSEVFDAFYAPDRRRMFYHSSSYTANPIACAAALANIGIWTHEPVRERITALIERQTHHLAKLQDHSAFENHRQCGTITALDLKTSQGGYLFDETPKLTAFFLERNIILRPLGNTIYVLPPYCVSEEDLIHIYTAIADAGDMFA